MPRKQARDAAAAADAEFCKYPLNMGADGRYLACSRCAISLSLRSSDIIRAISNSRTESFRIGEPSVAMAAAPPAARTSAPVKAGSISRNSSSV